jgi:predicted AAA+ superfamily ATPase
MIPREIQKELSTLLNEYPVVAVTGPRQSGKTTLSRMIKGFDYVNLEIPKNRSFAKEDPIGFLQQFEHRVILDEIQQVPELLSYIQGIVDENKENGQFIITGSHQLMLREAISQSLAGRVGLLTLLPFSISELEKVKLSFNRFEDYVFQGFLPRVYDQNQRPSVAYGNYFKTYVERDVRQLINLKDSMLFEKFMKLLAGRVGQLIDYASLAGDVGVDSKTIKHWISILEASYIIFRLSPYYENYGKRLVKSPKLYFTELGLLSYLLEIEKAEHVSRDPLVGNIFENLVILEFVKSRLNEGKQSNFYFLRDSNGNEIDLVYKIPSGLHAIEIKAASTFNSSFFKQIERFSKNGFPLTKVSLIYNGEAMRFSDNRSAIPFNGIKNLLG